MFLFGLAFNTVKIFLKPKIAKRESIERKKQTGEYSFFLMILVKHSLETEHD